MYDRLIFADGALERLRADLLAATPVESAAFVLARPVETPSGSLRLIVREIVHVSPEEYACRSPARVDLHPETVARAVARARDQGLSLFLTHTHPLSDAPEPSSFDVEGEHVLLPALVRRIPDAPHGRLILGHTGCTASILSPTERPLEVVDVGVSIRRGRDLRDTSPDPVYDRQVRAFGADGQGAIRSLHCAVVGAGGTGSLVLQQLAHLGVGALTIIDPDVIELSNLNRVVGARVLDTGRTKVDIAARLVREVSPGCTVRSVVGDVCDAATARALLDVDLFFCCTDSHGSRAVLNQLAYQYLVPGIDLGVVIRATEGRPLRIAGRVQALAPGLPCLVCSAILDPEQVRRDLLTEWERAQDPYIPGHGVTQPAVISINGTVASAAVTMMLAMVTDIAIEARHQQVRFELGSTRPVNGTPMDGCPVCSQRGALGRGDTWAMPGRPGSGAAP